MPKDIPEDLKKIDERIAALKQRYTNEEKEKKEENVSQAFIGLRLGVEFASGTIIGAAIGYILDEVFDFQFIMLLIFTMLGGFAGMLNAYRYMKSLDKEKDKGV